MKVFKDVRALMRAVKDGEVPVDVMTPKEAMRVLSMGRSSLDYIAGRGVIKSWRTDRFTLLDKADVMTFRRGMAK